jgi:hypothetical protein
MRNCSCGGPSRVENIRGPASQKKQEARDVLLRLRRCILCGKEWRTIECRATLEAMDEAKTFIIRQRRSV